MATPRTFRVLLVEDNPHVAELFRYAFKRLVTDRFGDDVSVRLEQAGDGHAAWQRIEASIGADPFDLIVLDLNLPVLDGNVLLARIRQTEGIASLPVLVVTAADEEACRDAMDRGANALLRKPVQMKDVRAALERIIGSQ